MSFLLKYRLPALVLFLANLGLVMALLLKLDELKWYYIAGTPLIAGLVGLLTNFFLANQANKKLREKSVLISLLLCLLFIIAFILHLLVYTNGTFRYKDVNGVERTYIKGYNYTASALKYKNDDAITSDAELLFDGFGGTDGKNDVWTPTSIRQTTLHFIISYCCTILFLSALISWILGVAYEKRYSDPQKAMQAILDERGVSNYEKYLLTFSAKQNDEKYKQIKFHIFLSYASNEQRLAETVYYSLTNSGHMVFFDRNNLPVGLEYNNAIYNAIIHSDIFIFMISPAAVAPGHYTLSELKFAEEKSPAAHGVLLPVMCAETPFEQIPTYAKSVTLLIPKGNIATEITAEVAKLYGENFKTFR